jgi:phosphatidate phosphatase APP1
MAKRATPPPRTQAKRKIGHYTHPDKKRANNPPAGLVTPQTDREAGKKPYAYDSHIDPPCNGQARPSTPHSRFRRFLSTHTSVSTNVYDPR